MARLRVGRVLGLLCFLANLVWGLECAYDSSYYTIDHFAQKLDSNFDPNEGNYSQTAHILEVNQAYVGKTLYCGIVERLLVTADNTINMRLMCFYISKDTRAFDGSCLSLYSESKSSQISMEFKKDAFVLKIEESFIECDNTTFKSQTLLFKQEGDRYVLQSYTGTIDNDDPDPFYRQKRDGKKIYMDAIDNGVLDTLEDHCYKKHDCQTWEEKHGIE
ncbi:hypothetical protein [Helicobacter bizzozeronii]|uniref:hypothetical protein n=1 Tax=Helicobacter bizzozeronii TaxID=56877 RepID=UPI000CF16683|nr:hypothetical protein [Helicobacter bizzozeronii]